MFARMPVSAAILCGGKGRRMGGVDKGHLLLDGRTFIEHQLDVLRPLTPHLMLIDRDASRRCAPDVRVLQDDIPAAGALGGLYTALNAAPTERVLVVACDMPFLTTEFLRCLMDAATDVDAVVPRDAEGRHPMCGLFHRRIAPRLKERIDAGLLRVEDALSSLTVRNLDPDTLAHVDRTGRLLVNVNTPAEYRSLARGNHQGTAFA